MHCFPDRDVRFYKLACYHAQVRPDPKLASEMEAAEVARLEAVRSAMSTEDLEAAVRETEELRQRQVRRLYAFSTPCY